MKAWHFCFALTLLAVAIQAMDDDWRSERPPRGKPRQVLRHSCELQRRQYRAERDKEEEAISPRDESPREEEVDQRALLTTAGFMRIHGEEVRHSIHSHTQTPSSSDDESILICLVDTKVDEYVNLWCSHCDVLYIEQCPHHITHSSSSSDDKYDYAESDDKYDDAENDGEYEYADSVAHDPSRTVLEEIEDNNIELFEIDPAERGRSKRKKIIYHRRTYAIREQSKNGTCNKHTPCFVSFKHGKKLEKMFSE